MGELKIEGLADITAADSRDIFANTMGELYAYQNEMWTRMKREQLLHERPAKLSAPVYETISREMIHDTYQPIPLKKFLADLTKLTKKAPDGCPVFVSCDQESDYEGGYYYYFEVGFERPPTDEEKADRKARNAEIAEVKAEYAAEEAKRERKEFERLRDKFAG